MDQKTENSNLDNIFVVSSGSFNFFNSSFHRVSSSQHLASKSRHEGLKMSGDEKFTRKNCVSKSPRNKTVEITNKHDKFE
jgi:hypothetical protein